MIKVKRLEKEFVTQVYEQQLIKDFVPEELKPIDTLLNLMEQDLYWCYGLFEDETFVAYAFFSRSANYQDILIDYFAVCSGKRNKGYGGIFLTLLQKELSEVNSILFEVESGKSAKDEDEKIICQKRLAFYRRNGLKDTKLHVSLFGIDMNVLYLPIQKEPTESEIEETLDAIYDILFGQEVHLEHVLVSKER